MGVILYNCMLLYCSVNGSACLLCCESDSVCELFGDLIRNILGSGYYFVVEYYGSVECEWRCSVGIDHVWSSKEVCFVPVIPVGFYMFLPYVLFVFVYVRSYLLI